MSGSMPIGLAAPIVGGAPEPGDDLVGHQQHVVFAQDGLDLLEIAARRQDHPAGALDRLGPQRRDGVGVLGEDQLFQLLGAAAGELLLGLARQAAVVKMRAERVQETGQRQVEAAVVARQAGQAAGGQGDAVIGLDAADDLLFPLPAQRVVDIPYHLDCRIIRLRAGIGEKDAAHRHRRALDQHLRQVDHRLVRFGGEAVVERQLAQLCRRRLDQPFVRKAQARAPQPGDALDIGAAVLVPDAHALAAADHQRPRLQMGFQVGVRVQQVGDVAGGGGIGAGRGHGGPLGQRTEGGQCRRFPARGEPGARPERQARALPWTRPPRGARLSARRVGGPLDPWTPFLKSRGPRAMPRPSA